MAEAGDDQPLGALVAYLARDAAADEGGMGFQVGAGDLDGLLVRLLDPIPGGLISESPDDGGCGGPGPARGGAAAPGPPLLRGRGQ